MYIHTNILWMCRILLDRSAIVQSPLPTTGGPWASSSCMTSPTRSLSAVSMTGELLQSLSRVRVNVELHTGVVQLCSWLVSYSSLWAVSAWMLSYRSCSTVPMTCELQQSFSSVRECWVTENVKLCPWLVSYIQQSPWMLSYRGVSLVSWLVPICGELEESF